MPEFPSDEDMATKSDKTTMKIGVVLAAIVVGIILVGSVFNQTSQNQKTQDRQVNQQSTHPTDDNTIAPQVQE